MDTSFIPKKNYAKKSHGKSYVGLFLTITSFIFVATVVSSIGVFFYKNFLEGEIENKNIILNKEKGGLDLSLIQSLSKFDQRIKTAGEILEDHISLVHLFDFLEKKTT